MFSFGKEKAPSFGNKQEGEKTVLKAVWMLGGEESTLLQAYYKDKEVMLSSGDITTEDRNLLTQKAEALAETLTEMGYTVSAEDIESFDPAEELTA